MRKVSKTLLMSFATTIQWLFYWHLMRNTISRHFTHAIVMNVELEILLLIFSTSSILIETELRLRFFLICVTIVCKFEKHWRYCTFVPPLSLELGFRLVLSRVSSWWIINKRGVRKCNNGKTLLSSCHMDTLPSLVLQYNHVSIYLHGRHPY